MTELFGDLPGRVQTESTGRKGGGKKARRARSGVILAICLALVAGAAFAGFTWLKPMIDGWRSPKDYPGPGSGVVQVVIREGESGSQIAASLASAGVVKTADAFSSAARANPKSSQIQPGTYQLKKEMKAADALALLLTKAARISIRVQLPEGLRANDALARIAKATGFSVNQLKAAAKSPAAGLPAEAKGNLEGYLFPATYSFNPGIKPVEVINEMVDAYHEAMTKAGVPAAKQRQVLTLASIVQGESGDEKDMPKIARVFTNRLTQKMPLQSDVTVLYANNAKPAVTTTDAMRANKSPYNTYAHPGLPPGPVNSPGLAAIQAAYKPAPGPWLYFVAVNPDTGETRYATTPAEHAANVRLFQAWLRSHSKKTP